jgi:outer membrane lipoprotein-sorting protein
VRRPRPSRSSRPGPAFRLRIVGAALLLGVLGGCATVPPAPPRPVAEEARTALARIEQYRASLHDLRSLTDITVRRDGKARRLSGVLLLLGAPASLRFEALTPFGIPALVVAGDPKSLTLWEVLDNRAYIAPATPDANRRWLGLALGGEDLVALLSGRVRPMPDPTTVDLIAPDGIGPSLRLAGAGGEQRIWFDPATGQARQVEWTGKDPARVTFTPAPADGPPVGLSLETPDGALRVTVVYHDPRINTSFDPALLTLTVPENVRIQDFR